MTTEIDLKDGTITYHLDVGFEAVPFAFATDFEPSEGGYAEDIDPQVSAVTPGTYADTLLMEGVPAALKAHWQDKFDKWYETNVPAQEQVQEKCDELVRAEMDDHFDDDCF